jgi:hypothetical protein
MSLRTIFLSRLIGLYCIVVSLSMLTHPALTIDTVRALIHNAPLSLMVGVIALAVGLAMVLGHNVWSGGVLAVIITLIGWITLIKSLVFLFLPPESVYNFYLGGLRYAQLFYLYAGITLVIGIYLTYAGFRSRAG